VDEQTLDRVAARLAAVPKGTVVLTGAGVSQPSGIPTFREEGGIWDRYDPAEYGHIAAFLRDPHRVWRMLFELDEVVRVAGPNPAHVAIAELEAIGSVGCVLTQNADALHQRAGSREVVELHGTTARLRCLTCDDVRPREAVEEELDARRVPCCSACGSVLKPDVVMFGEMLPADALSRAEEEAVADCSTLVVAGTSAEVYPVAGLPDEPRRHGAEVVEVNPQPVLRADHSLEGAAEDLLPALVRRVRDLVRG